MFIICRAAGFYLPSHKVHRSASEYNLYYLSRYPGVVLVSKLQTLICKRKVWIGTLGARSGRFCMSTWRL